MSPQIWWYTARATGITAWIGATASVLWGLALSGRTLGDRPRPAWMLDLHRFLGAVAVVFTAFHMAALVADSFVHFDLADLTVPGASDWKTLPVAWGVVAFWLLAIVEVTSLMMRRLSRRFWHAIHLSSLVVYSTATAHLLTAGTDAGNRVLLLAALSSVVATVFLGAYRVFVPKRARAATRSNGQAARGPAAARVDPGNPAAPNDQLALVASDAAVGPGLTAPAPSGKARAAEARAALAARRDAAKEPGTDDDRAETDPPPVGVSGSARERAATARAAFAAQKSGDG